MLMEIAPLQTRHRKRRGRLSSLLPSFEFGQGDRRQTGGAMALQFGLRPCLTVTQTRQLLGVAEETCDLAPRFVIARDGRRRHVDLRAQEQRRTVGGGIDDFDHAPIALALPMMEHLRIEYDALVARRT
jgi:hypothetical protein